MADIRKLQSKNLNEVSLSNTYMYLLNLTTNVEYRMSLDRVVNNATSVGVGASMYAGVANDIMTFKSLNSSSPSILNLSDDNSTLTLSIDQSNIDLASCKNTTSNFLSTVDLADATIATGLLPVTSGGTGGSAAALSWVDRGICYYNGTTSPPAIYSTAAGLNGQVVIGKTGGNPEFATLTSTGGTIGFTTGANTLNLEVLSADNLGNHTATTTLNMNGFNVQTGGGWISNLGTNKGINIDANSKVFIGDSSTTAFYSDALNIDGGIEFTGEANQFIQMGTPTTGNGFNLSIQGGDYGSASGNGGNIHVAGGRSTTGIAGDVSMYTGRAADSLNDGEFNVWARDMNGTEFKVLRANGGKVIISNLSGTSVGAAVADITQGGATLNQAVLRLSQRDNDTEIIALEGTTAADDSTPMTLSAGVTGAKTAAVKIKYGDPSSQQTGWIRIYDSGI